MAGSRVLVAGMLAGVPGQGGATWAVLQYLLGLRRLGHDVMLVEQIDAPPPSNGCEGPPPQVRRYFRDVVKAFGLEDRASLIVSGADRALGVPLPRLIEFARSSDVLLNLSGSLRDERVLSCVESRVYVDLDPAFTQLWADSGQADMGFAHHNRFVTVGLELGRANCPVPTCGFSWLHTVPPVDLQSWPTGRLPRRRSFTTIANWRSYGSIEARGVRYGQKAHSFRELIDLPRRSEHQIELALSIDPLEIDDLRRLDRNRWKRVDPWSVAGTPDDYQVYIRSSFGELAVAKSGYVVGRTGWFSDRSVCYLASGRPVVAQETGFSNHLPTGTGLLSFTNADEAADRLDRVLSDPEEHANAARQIAEEFFDARQVLTRLLEVTSRTAATP
jgi:glycosyltransferase involved in cell wall biosynthesis